MIYNSKEVGQNILNQVENEIKNLDSKERPTIAIVRIGDNIGSISYEKSIKKLLEPLNIKVVSHTFNNNIKQQEFIKEIQKLNNDIDTHGILILQPLPNSFDKNLISSIINPKKDVDASNPLNLGKLMIGDKTGFIPCTAEAVMELLDYYGHKLKGKNIVIINNSDVIGKPLSILLTNRFATVTLCHEFTENLEDIVQKADIVITAAGVYGLIKPEMLNSQTTLIDLAITQEKDNKGKLILNNNKPIRCGDSLEDCKDIAANIISATPGCGGGTGPITTALLAKNVLKSYILAQGDLVGNNRK